MKVALAVFLALMVPVVVVAQDVVEDKPAVPEIEKQFTMGRIAEKEGRFAAADETYRAIVEKWPNDMEFTPRAMLHRIACLWNQGKQAEARELAGQVLAKYEGNEKLEKAARSFLAGLDERQREGEANRDTDVPRSARTLSHRIEFLRRTWKEQGVEEEEIERRIERIKAEFEEQKAERRRMEEESKRLQDLGLSHAEAMRRIEEARRERDRLDDERFRERHDRGMREAREEFVRLAERLGIAPEEAERFIEEHRQGGPERQFRRIRQFEEAVEHVRKAVHEAQERIDHGERAIERFRRNLENVSEEREHVVGRLARHVEDLTGRVERLEKLMDRAHEELVPHLKEMQERIERLEKKDEKDK